MTDAANKQVNVRGQEMQQDKKLGKHRRIMCGRDNEGHTGKFSKQTECRRKEKGNERGDDRVGEQVVTAQSSNQTLLSSDCSKPVPS